MARTKRLLTGRNADPDNPLLDIGPFREWLIRQRAAGMPRRDLAVHVGTSERRVEMWMNDQGTRYVSLDSVDAAGCAHDNPFLLRELYPSVYALPEWLDGDEVAA